MDEELLRLRIKSAIDHIDKVIKDLKDMSLEDFKKSDLLCRAVSFSVMQIGEQLGRLYDKYGDLYPNIEWNKAKFMRNMIAHDYINVNLDRVYSTVKNDLPELKDQLQSLLD